MKYYKTIVKTKINLLANLEHTYLKGLISMAISFESAIFLAKWQQNEIDFI